MGSPIDVTGVQDPANNIRRSETASLAEASLAAVMRGPPSGTTTSTEGPPSGSYVVPGKGVGNPGMHRLPSGAIAETSGPPTGTIDEHLKGYSTGSPIDVTGVQHPVIEHRRSNTAS
jgi:hypothetical protein